VTRQFAIWFGLYPALANFAIAGALGWWIYGAAPLVPIDGALRDTWISSFLISFTAWFVFAPTVESWVRLGAFPARVPPRSSAAARFASLPGWLRALAFGAAGLALVGAPAGLALRALAPESLSLPAFLAWKASAAALVGGLVAQAIAWTSLTAEPGMAKAVPRFPVLDLAAALEFYEKRLGFRKLFEIEGYAGVARSDFELHLFQMSHPELPKWTSCRVNVRGVDELYAECTRAGVIHPNGALANQPWGFREFTVVDLCGNAIVFGQWLG
jgi:catechol 2,3-dioxygenase-like lactoylglutathione lyase family enzyme